MFKYNKLVDNLLCYLIFISNFLYKYSIFKYCCKKSIFVEENRIMNEIYKIKIRKYKKYRDDEISIIYRIDDVKFKEDDGPITF